MDYLCVSDRGLTAGNGAHGRLRGLPTWAQPCAVKTRRHLFLASFQERPSCLHVTAGRNFKVHKWFHHELDLPWAPYSAWRKSGDVIVFRTRRDTSSQLKRRWREDVWLEEGDGLSLVDGRVQG